MKEPTIKPPTLPAGIDAALKECEDASQALRDAATRLETAVANLQSIVFIDRAQND